MSEESWLPVVGWEGWYEVSDRGQVRRVRPAPGVVVGRLLRSPVDSRGYRKVILTRAGRSAVVMVHTLVLEAFVGPRPPGHEPDHRDFDRSNNRVSNLRWLPRRLNRARIRRDRLPRGEQKSTAKLTAGDVHAIRASDESLHALANRYGVHHTHIRNVRAGIKWAHLPGAVPLPGKLRGERHPMARLTETDVRRIKALRAAKVPYRTIMAEFGVAKSTLTHIMSGRLWKGVG